MLRSVHFLQRFQDVVHVWQKVFPLIDEALPILATRITEVLVMLAKKELVGHAGDVSQTDDMARFHCASSS